MIRKITIVASLLLATIIAVGCSEKQPQTTLCVNPLTYTDIPDNDFIRVGDDYYMVSTTMYFCPGAPIMHSKDLVHWKIINYVYDYLADDDIYNLAPGIRHAYGKGQWATSIRYYDGIYYIFFCSNDQQKTYVYTTDDIAKGNWTRKTVIDKIFHDATLLKDDDGKMYVIYSNGDIRITEFEPDLSGVKEGGVDQLLFSSPREGYMLRAEGSHVYHIGDYYYVLVIDWPAGGVRTETCYRSKTLLGEYESKTILQGAFDGRGDGVAQGGIIQTQNGDWYAMMFQDHGAVGRIPTLQPVTWVDDWPILGDNGIPVKSFEVNLPEDGQDYVWANDEFSSEELALVWQWNHKPLDGFWSLSERPGWLRLTTGALADDIELARNTLTQRTVGPKCESEIRMDVTNMKAGDFAGLCAFQSNRCQIGVKVDEQGKKSLVVVNRTLKDGVSTIFEQALEQNDIFLKVIYDFDNDTAKVAYSLNGIDFNVVDYELKMLYTLDYFTGYRTAIFNYGNKNLGGYVDIDYFHQVLL